MIKTGKGWTLINGDSSAVLKKLGPNRVDSVVTDPPAGIGFMGKAWDSDMGGRDQWIAWLAEIMGEALRVLKPGGHALVWAIPRTSGWTQRALEDAGFEIRDVIAHLFGTGFPKSLTSKTGMPEGQGTALKPGAEFWILARKPIDGTVAGNVSKWGTGGLNIDGCRIGSEARPVMVRTETVVGANSMSGTSTGATPSGELTTLGRWPANVVLDEEAAALLDAQSGVLTSGTKKGGQYARDSGVHDGGQRADGTACYADSGGASRFFAVFPAEGACNEPVSGAESCSTGEPHPAGGSAPSRARANPSPGTNTEPASTHETPSASGTSRASGTPTIPSTGSASSPEPLHGRPTPSRPPASGAGPSEATVTTRTTTAPSTSCGSAEAATSANTSTTWEVGGPDFERFKYVAKPGTKERDAGCDHLPAKSGGEATGREDDSAGVANPRAGAGRGGGRKNHHPTVKSIALMRWLCRLVTPPGGVVLDCFAGSGSTGVAALAEGFSFIGVEREAEYAAIAGARLEHAVQITEHSNG